MPENTPSHAHFDAAGSSIVVEHLTITNTDTLHEGKRWTTGERGPIVDEPAELAGADVTTFFTEALRIGAHALSVTGQAQESQALERMLREVGDKTAESVDKAAEATTRVVQQATEDVTRAAGAAKTSIADADAQHRKALGEALDDAKREMNAEIGRLFGGEHPELVERLRSLLATFEKDLNARAQSHAEQLLAQAIAQFDLNNPASPMAQHAAELATRQQELATRLNANHTDLATALGELRTALKVREATTALARVTPIKGDSYAGRVHTLLAEIAAGAGDEYADTSRITGRLARCFKGDGLLTLGDSSARIVVEMTDSPRSTWSSYFDEAERNRDAATSLGLVRTPEQNAGQTVRVIGARRVVLAFDPDDGDAELLRTVVHLLRACATAAAARKGSEQVVTAEEKISEALAELAKIGVIKKLAGGVMRNATKIESQCNGLNAGIRRLLDQALSALSGTAAENAGESQADDAA